MANHLNWKIVDDIAAELGASVSARHKWRQRDRGVPLEWRLKIVTELCARGAPVSIADFDGLPVKPGRIAA